MNAELRRQHEMFKACRARIAPMPARPLVVIVPSPPVIAPVPTSTQFRCGSTMCTISGADRALAEDLLANCEPTVRKIARATASVFNTEPWAAFAPRKIGEVPAIRHVAMAATRMKTVLSFPAIGRRFGGFNHTTVIAAIRKADPVAVASVLAILDGESGT